LQAKGRRAFPRDSGQLAVKSAQVDPSAQQYPLFPAMLNRRAHDRLPCKLHDLVMTHVNSILVIREYFHRVHLERVR
jgi:hypothetical protein